jgi:hypothetical protein
MMKEEKKEKEQKNGLNIIRGRVTSMRKKLLLLALIFCMSLWSVFSYATLTQVWRYDAEAGNLLDTTFIARGMCYNPVTDHVLVAKTTPAISIFTASNGTSVGSMNVTGIAGGVIALVKIRSASNGMIWGANVSTNTKTGALRIYRWADEASAPVEIYHNLASDSTAGDGIAVGPPLPAASVGAGTTLRLGDYWTLTYNGDSIVTFYFQIQGNHASVQNLIYQMVSYDTGYSISAINKITATGVNGSAIRGIAVDEDGYIYLTNNGVVGRVTTDGSGLEVFSDAISNSSFMLGSPGIGYVKINGKKYLGGLNPRVVIGYSSSEGYREGFLADITNGPQRASVIDFTPVRPMPSTVPLPGYRNINGTGDFAGVSDGRLFYLITNNFLGCFTLASATTKYWDNGGGDGRWANPSNWNPDGVPNGVDDVYLDNSIVSGNYTVTIDDNTTKSVRMLYVGDPITGNNISLLITTTASIYSTSIVLNVAGSMDSTVDMTFYNGGRLINQGRLSPVVMNQSGWNTAEFKDGSYCHHSTAQSFTSPFPALGSAMGGTIWAPSAALEVEAPGTGSFALSLSNRTYGNLVLSGVAGRNYTGTGGMPFTIQGNLQINSNVSTNITMTGQWILMGNIIHNGLYASLGTSSAGGLVFGGLSQQTVNGSGGTLSIPTCNINNANGVVLQRDLNVSNLIMNSGNVYTGSNSLVMGASGNAGVLAWTAGNVVGNLVRGIPAATGSYVFPVGAGANDNTATVAFTAAPTAGVMTTKFVASNPGSNGLPLSDTDALNISYAAPEGYWSIGGISGGTYDLTLKADGFSLGDISNRNNVRILKRANSASSWSVDGTPGTNSGTSIARTGLTGFSEFGIGGDTSVPVELSDFMTE